jgi:hypothetical protein
VSNDAISLHFSESESSVASSAFQGLASELGDGTATARVDLVVHHVLETLIVGGAQKDAGRHESASVAVKHGLVSSLLIARLVQLRRNVFHRVLRKGSCVSFSAILHRRHFAQQTLNQLSNGHARRNRVRIDDEIRRNRLHREGHVFLAIRDAHSSLLTVASSKLVSNLRSANSSNANLFEKGC